MGSTGEVVVREASLAPLPVPAVHREPDPTPALPVTPSNELVALLTLQLRHQDEELETAKGIIDALRRDVAQLTRRLEDEATIHEHQLQAQKDRLGHALEEERANLKVTYRAPAKVQDMIDSLPLVVGAIRYCVTGDGDQVDLEGALKRLEKWMEGFQRALHDEKP